MISLDNVLLQLHQQLQFPLHYHVPGLTLGLPSENPFCSCPPTDSNRTTNSAWCRIGLDARVYSGVDSPLSKGVVKYITFFINQLFWDGTSAQPKPLHLLVISSQSQNPANSRAFYLISHTKTTALLLVISQLSKRMIGR